MSDAIESNFDEHLVDTASAELQNEQPCQYPLDVLQHGNSVPVLGSISTLNCEVLANLENALAHNRMLDENLRQLEVKLRAKLHECRLKLSQASWLDRPKKDHKEKFTYFNFGKPYFRDKTGCSAPDNEDTILMCKSEMYDFSIREPAKQWTVKDKFKLSQIILNKSKEMKKKKLHSQILALKRKNKTLQSELIDDKIFELHEKVLNANDESIDSLALPIHQEYNWNRIADLCKNRHNAKECRSLWKLFLHPSINKNSWTESEQKSLQKIAKKRTFQDWDAIAQEIGTGRSSYQCFLFYLSYVRKIKTSQHWTKQEEEQLISLVEYHRQNNYIPWRIISASMSNRTKIQVYNKYNRLTELRKGKFLPEEDSVILTCVNIFGANFRRVSEYLQGRSRTQCQERYRILSKRQYSTVWTAEEDHKLIQLMANQDHGSTNFSILSQYFPDKDRVNIRSRYLTLSKWIQNNPNVSITLAPRRGARRLAHGKSTDDLNRAVENLKKRLEVKEIATEKKGITIDSPENVIDDAILALIATATIRETEAKKIQILKEEQNTEFMIENKKCKTPALNGLLTILNAQSHQQKSILENPEPGPSTIQMKTFPKIYFCNVNIENKINTSENISIQKWLYLLPPNYQTITGCKQLLSYYSSIKDDSEEECIPSHYWEREEMKLLLARFKSLFFWPMRLSNVPPDVCKKTDPINNFPSTSKLDETPIDDCEDDSE